MSMTSESEEDRLAQLSCRIEDWLRDSSSRAEALRELVAEVRRGHSVTGFATQSESAATTVSAATGSHLIRFVRTLEMTSDQAGILGSLVEHAAPAAPRVVLFIVRGESVIGWAARGFPAEFAPRSASLPLSRATLLSRSHERCAVVIEPPLARTGNAELLEKLGGISPSQLLAAPLWVRDRVAAVLYADTGKTGEPWMPDMLCLMATVAALNLEIQPVRQKHPRPTTGPEITIDEPEAPAASAIEFDELPEMREPVAVDQSADSGNEEQAALNEEALRFARLLASEIVLYNAAELEDGRRQKDIYQRLKDEIDRSHQMFSERFSAQQPSTAECFRKELVRVLAEGDEAALTLPWC